jgi:hypothetical protein
MELTIEKALEIQSKQLLEWSTVLQPTVYKQVATIVHNQNLVPKIVKNPHQIPRGNDITTIVRNISIGNLELYESYL